MAYEPKTWECGETITAEALNHIEQGIANSGGGTSEPLIIRYTGESRVDGDYTYYATDKTFAEVKEAFNSGRTVLLFGNYDNPQFDIGRRAISYTGGNSVKTVLFGDSYMLSAEAENDFLEYEYEGIL